MRGYLSDRPTFGPRERGWLRKRDWLAAILCCALYLALLTVMQDEKAFVSGMSAYCFYVLISTEWAKRYEKIFWVVISLFVVIHVLGLSVVKLPNYTGPSLFVATPFMLIDFFAMWGILRWALRKAN